MVHNRRTGRDDRLDERSSFGGGVSEGADTSSASTTAGARSSGSLQRGPALESAARICGWRLPPAVCSIGTDMTSTWRRRPSVVDRRQATSPVGSRPSVGEHIVVDGDVRRRQADGGLPRRPSCNSRADGRGPVGGTSSCTGKTLGLTRHRERHGREVARLAQRARHGGRRSRLDLQPGSITDRVEECARGRPDVRSSSTSCSPAPTS